MIVFDIETGPLSEAELRQMMKAEDPPFDPASVKPFDPGSVKYGNIKDPGKKAEKLAECQRKHEEDSANAEKNYETSRVEKRAAYEKTFIEGATLNALTCRILAIGYRPLGGQPQAKYGSGQDPSQDECEILTHFWQVAKHTSENSGLLIGHNSKGFDLPMIIQRSWYHGLTPSVPVLDRGRYWMPWIVDTIDVWQAGSRNNYVSLDALAKFFRVGQKTGDGALFWKRFLSADPAERQASIDYLLNDVEITFRVAEKLGVICGAE